VRFWCAWRIAGGLSSTGSPNRSQKSHTFRHNIGGILIHWLKEQKELQRDAHHLLTLLLELQTGLGLRLETEAFEPLKLVTEMGKMAKCAKLLLQWQPESPSPEFHQAIRQHLEARFVRAERWAQHSA